MYNKIDILSLDETELSDYIVSLGEPAYRAKQIYSWLNKGCSVDEMSNLPKQLRQKLNENADVRLPEIENKLVSKIDGTIKYLFRLCDGECIESVVMKYDHGNTICVSSQAGCRMGCRFCASSVSGFSRSLLPSEILGQIIIAQKDSGEHISNIVMMGIGEPLDNFDNVIKFLKLVNSENGLNIGHRHISISTCGLADKIYKLAELNLQITLSISLHAASDVERSALMPVNNKFSIGELLTACKSYFDKTGRRISFEYALIAGENDSAEDADRLAAVLCKYLTHDIPFHVNLIPVNEVSENRYRTSPKESAAKFMSALEKRGIEATVRRKLGADINAACGQLRRQKMQVKSNA